ncbi:Major intracellular serine protease precursor [uncultured Clostridium sp.]|nr:Major intracellular serine protease precursor [uncultured Clostridium sp.]
MTEIGKLINLINFNKENEVKSLGYSISYGINLVNATNMWSKGYTGKNVIIAVIDTGCDKDHPDLKDRIVEGRNFTTDDGGNPDIYTDYDGHGTHVSGIIAANNSKNGVVGVAPSAKLMILKALAKGGVGQYLWIIDAIDYAVSKKVDIISMSLGGPNDVPQLHQAIINAINNNILVVCAAGNSGDNSALTDELDYPGAYEEVIEVGAIDMNKVPAYFSDSNKELDVLAPGVSILSTYKNQSYATLSGTSMAAPYVSGSLALIIEWSTNEFGRKLSEPELYAQLIKMTVSINYPRSMQGNGYVYLNPYIVTRKI